VDAGYDAFCITVDTQVYSRRERDIAQRFVKSWRTAARPGPPGSVLVGRNFKRVKDKFPDVKFMLKGIGTGGDAGSPASTACGASTAQPWRPPARPRARIGGGPAGSDRRGGGPRAKIAVDGSFSRGSGIVKAICLGADWVGMGGSIAGLAAAGSAGIERVIELLEEEMKEVMGLLGVTSLKQLDKSYIAAATPPTARHASAFPLLNLEDQGTDHRWGAPLQWRVGIFCAVRALALDYSAAARQRLALPLPQQTASWSPSPS
jgi:glycolate oxidase